MATEQHYDSQGNMIQGDAWLNPENYLMVFAPELADEYQHVMETGEDPSGIAVALQEIKAYAVGMVRYAISPGDSVAVDPFTHEALINPQTDKPFTIEDTGVKRADCVGPTTSIIGREQQAAEIIVAIYNKLI
jgi:hypothetical protein